MTKPPKQLSREALDFSPGLLAIQESPPPRLPRTILLIVAALFVILLLWATFGELDIVSTAQGKLVPQTYVKIVQPSDSGVVLDILVAEGDVVEEGQVLMRMDAKLTQADVRTIRNDYELKRLQLHRIDAELAGSPMTPDDKYPHELFNRVTEQYKANIKAYQDAVSQEKSSLDKARSDLLAAEESLRKLKEVLPSYLKSAEAFEKVGKDGYVSHLAVVEKRREYIEKSHDLRAQEAAVASLNSVITSSKRRLIQIESNYHRDLQNERSETEGQFKRLHEELGKIEYKEGMLALRAPQKGIIRDMATHTLGTVVSPGSVLMSLVPYNEPLRAEVYIRNEDVGFVHIGQRVKVKLTAYPFQKYGMIEGEISYIDPDAAEAGANEASAAVENMRYKSLVTLDKQQLQIEEELLELTPGMQVIVDIHLGNRTVMEYLLSPVQKAWHESGRER